MDSPTHALRFGEAIQLVAIYPTMNVRYLLLQVILAGHASMLR
ncbi:MAG TPA: hypothetical protein VGQ89_16815 [Candidatus Limnocylindrales bacterium]|nr:hypothetical protein [Candidatus Limnocylindrales bacterium]